MSSVEHFYLAWEEKINTMVILVYLLAMICFWLGYLISTIIFGWIFFAVKKTIYGILLPSKEVELEGLTLLSAAGLSVYVNFFFSLLLFSWFEYHPNWFILTPLFIFTWYNAASNAQSSQWSSGALHWGMLIGVISFLLSLSQFL